MLLTIKCPKCRGPMWEEYLPDTPRIIDLACIICGLRRHYPKDVYNKNRKKLEEGLCAKR